MSNPFVDVLIVWSEIPETTLFVVLHIPCENVSMVKRWHKHFVNSSNTPPDIQRELMESFYDADGVFAHKRFTEPVKGSFDLVIHCGIIV